MSESTRGRRKSMIGTVVSVKMEKTAVVSVERNYPHRLYHKIIRTSKRYMAHDPENAAVLGDTVRIVETRPLSKNKRWRIAETLTRGNVAEVAPREIGVPEEGLYHPEPPAPVAPAATAVAEPEAVAPAEPEAEAEAAPEEPVAPAEDAPVAEADEAASAESESTPAAEAEPAPETDDAPTEDAPEGEEKE